MRAYVLRTQKQADRLLLLLRETWKAQADAGAPLEVVVQALTKRRAGAQLRRYWWILDQVARQVVVAERRYPKEHWHEYFKQKFIGYEELPDGAGKIGLSTSTLDAEQFGEYVYKIEEHAVEDLCVVFPEQEN